jgi:glycosyltransferase involved in cell wall biosynthesis
MIVPQKLALVMISNFGRADGGRETWAYQFLPRLLARHAGLSVDLYALRVDGQPDNRPELENAIPEGGRGRFQQRFFSARQNRIPNSLKMIWAMFRHDWFAYEKDFQLALGVGSFIELTCMLAAPGLRGVPKAVWLRTIYVDEKSDRIPAWLRPLARIVETAVLRRADLIIANGDDTAAYYRARGLHVEVIKNAVDLDRWRMPPPRLERPIDVAFIGRLTAVKGAAEFLEACRRLTAHSGAGRFRFHAIGDGSFTPQAEELAAQDRLTYHGFVPNDALPDRLGQMDVCVALTFVRQAAGDKIGGSGTSNALLEQMAAGRVCLCWDNAAFRQIVDEQSAYLVAQGDIDGLVIALEAIAKDPEDAIRRARNGAKLAEDYDIEMHMDRFERAVTPWLALRS